MSSNPVQLSLSDDPDRITAIALTLSKISHPSIPSIESTFAEGKVATLILSSPKGEPLSAFTAPNESFIKAIASVASVMAFMHERHVSIGKIDMSRILVRPDHSAFINNVEDFVDPADKSAQQADVTQFLHLVSSVLDNTDSIRERINGSTNQKLIDSTHASIARARKQSFTARQLAEELRHSLWFEARPAPPIKPNRRHHLLKLLAAVAIAGLLTGFIYRSSQASSAPNPSPVKVEAGVVTVDNERFTVGKPDDKIVVGNWNCDGNATIALLQQSTGTVYIYDSWPAPGDTATPRSISVDEPASDIERVHHDKCDELKVRTETGTKTIEVNK